MSNRELASLIWIIITVIFVLYLDYKDKNDVLKVILKALIKVLKVPIVKSFIFYNVVCIVVLSIWNFKRIIFTDFWFIKDYFVTVVLLLFPILKKIMDGNTIQSIIKNEWIALLSLTGVVVFINDNYPLSIIWELILIPVMVFLVMMQTISLYSDEESHHKVGKMITGIITLITLLIIFKSVKLLITNIEDVLNIDFWLSYGFEIFILMINIPNLYISYKLFVIEKIILLSKRHNKIYNYFLYYYKKILLKFKIMWNKNIFPVIFPFENIVVTKTYLGARKYIITVSDDLIFTKEEERDIICALLLSPQKYIRSKDAKDFYPISIDVVSEKRKLRSFWKDKFIISNLLENQYVGVEEQEVIIEWKDKHS